MRKKALFIVGSPPYASLSPGEQAVKNRLDLQYEVIEKRDDEATALDVLDKTIVVISSSINEAQKIGREFRDVAVPIVVSSVELYGLMGMCDRRRSEDYGQEPGQTSIDIIHSGHPGHPLMANKIGVVAVSSDELRLSMCWAKELPKDAEKIASIDRKMSKEDAKIAASKEDKPKLVLFGCRAATKMISPEILLDGEGNAVKAEASAPELFPAKRVAFPFDYNIQNTEGLHVNFWLLFDAAIDWAVGLINIRQFDEVFREEWQQIHLRRCKGYGVLNNATGFDGKHAPENLVGLALSGGGIRSATFCLGVLQALHERKLLRIFDYLSTVSGGGYLGGWWSAWLSRPEGDKNTGLFPVPESIEPDRLAEYRWRTGSAKIAEGSLSAGDDPIHHLRLFANYLTPRTGALSADTWRAISVISRNLILTWLMLLPLLLAFVFVAQSSFFIAQPEANFLHTHWLDARNIAQAREQTAGTIKDQDELKKFNLETDRLLNEERTKYFAFLKQRAVFIGELLIFFVGWIGLMFVSFMRSNATFPLLVKIKERIWKYESDTFRWNFGRAGVAHLVGGGGFSLVIILTLMLIWPAGAAGVLQWPEKLWGWFYPRSSWLGPGLIVWVLVGLTLMLITMPWQRLEDGLSEAKTEDELRLGVWRNQISRVHGQLFVTLCVLAVVLVFAAYGHEMFDYLLRDAEPRKQLLGYVAKAGGWVTFAGAIFGAIFSALKSAPSGGHDSADVKPPPAWHKAIFAITPLLVIITLMIIAAWTAHEIASGLANRQESPWALTQIILIGVLLALFFALFEIPWNTEWIPRFVLPLVSIVTIGAAIAFYLLRPFYSFTSSVQVTLVRLAAVVAGVLILRLGLKGNRWSGGLGRLQARAIFKKPKQKDRSKAKPKDPGETQPEDKNKLRRSQLLNKLMVAGFALVVTLAGWIVGGRLGSTVSNRTGLTLCALTAIVLCLLYVVMEMFFAKGDNRRSLALLTSVYLISLLLMLISFNTEAASKLAYVFLGLCVITFTWVMAFGWMADPNAISMHGFYKSRLVRAYLGASNPQRLDKLYEITETVAGDDVLLSDLKNCERGAPYHLLNTTLNLTGGRDLATALRSSAMFVLSRLYCGSFRTGFQRSTGYANGRLSLGMAVATSGAAVSPGMGAGKSTASQAMLMTLLNLRLGFWAPTPSGEHWQDAQARLWPFYTLREFLSQTNDLSSYCYLTDGGHFDNLGIYSLVERGCRYIVAVDAVADPQPCFSDLGNAIRRCRIDFDADVDLDITPFIKGTKDDAFAKKHFAVGRIVYSEDHVKRLGWKDITKQARTGVIVYIKSSLLKNEKELRSDVRQYGMENSDFPQQSTVNQWFDEAQFESYRALGRHSALTAFARLEKDPSQNKREKLNEKDGRRALSGWEQRELAELQKEFRMSTCIKEGVALTAQSIETLFDSLDPHRNELVAGMRRT